MIIPLFITQAPTCFSTFVPSSGSILYPCELLESPKWLCHRDVPLYCKCWCALDVVVSCVTVSSWAHTCVEQCSSDDKLCHNKHKGTNQLTYSRQFRSYLSQKYSRQNTNHSRHHHDDSKFKFHTANIKLLLHHHTTVTVSTCNSCFHPAADSQPLHL
jgi:hypothetical protein